MDFLIDHLLARPEVVAWVTAHMRLIIAIVTAIALFNALSRLIPDRAWAWLEVKAPWATAIIRFLRAMNTDGVKGAKQGVVLAKTLGETIVALINVFRGGPPSDGGTGGTGDGPSTPATKTNAPSSSLTHRTSARHGLLAYLQMAALLLFGLGSIGCAGTFEEARLAGMQAKGPSSVASAAHARDDARCAKLDDDRALYGAIAKASAALAGASGLTAIPVNNHTIEVALGTSAIALGAIAVGAVVLEESKGAAWARECATP